MMTKTLIFKFRVLALCLLMGISFTSCSGDDDANDLANLLGDCLPGLSELPLSALGTYTGELTTQSSGSTPTTTTGTATIVESGCKTYTINFSGNTPAITDIVFVALGGSFTFGDSDRKLAVDISEEGVLVVAKTSDPVISFVEGIKQ